MVRTKASSRQTVSSASSASSVSSRSCGPEKLGPPVHITLRQDHLAINIASFQDLPPLSRVEFTQHDFSAAGVQTRVCEMRLTAEQLKCFPVLVRFWVDFSAECPAEQRPDTLERCLFFVGDRHCRLHFVEVILAWHDRFRHESWLSPEEASDTKAEEVSKIPLGEDELDFLAHHLISAEERRAFWGFALFLQHHRLQSLVAKLTARDIEADENMSLRRIRELLGVPPAGRLPQHDALLALLEENVPLRETISMRMLRKMLATTTFEYHLRDVGYPLGDDAYRTMTALTSASRALRPTTASRSSPPTRPSSASSSPTPGTSRHHPLPLHPLPLHHLPCPRRRPPTLRLSPWAPLPQVPPWRCHRSPCLRDFIFPQFFGAFSGNVESGKIKSS